MASPSAAFLCSLLALLLWAPVGFLIAGRLPIGRGLRLAVAPVLGWAVQDVSALHVSMVGGLHIGAQGIQHPHRMSAVKHPGQDLLADETCAAGQKRLHVNVLPPGRRAAGRLRRGAA